MLAMAKAKKTRFPKHVLSRFVCSPKLSRCEPARSVIEEYSDLFIELYESSNGNSMENALNGTFDAVYNDGWIWYPRDRWRTAWQITMTAAKQHGGTSVGPYKKSLYRHAVMLRNPSSRYEGVK